MYQDFVAIYTNVQGIISSIQNVKSITIKKALNSDSNNCDIELINIGKLNELDGEIKYQPNESIRVYASRDEPLDLSNNSHLIGTYLIKDYSIDVDKQILTLKCKDYTYFMLNKIYVYRDDLNKKPNEIIENIVQVVNENGNDTGNFPTDIASVDSNGLSFSTVSFVSNAKTAFECITELSQPDMTGDDKTYQFWLDANGVFHWLYPSSVAEEQVLQYCKYPVYEVSLDKPESESAKLIIYNAGNDLNDDAIEDFAYNKNATDVAEAMISQPMTEISSELRLSIKAQYGLADTSNATILTVMTNDLFVNKCKALAQAKCDRIFASIGTGLWSAKVRIYGNNYEVGGLYTIVCPYTGFVARDMRLSNITHYMDYNGWMTSLDLDEEA